MTRVHREVSVCKVVAVPEVQCCCCAVTNNYNNYEVTAALKCIEYADTGHQQSHAAVERCEPICAPAICMNYEFCSLSPDLGSQHYAALLPIPVVMVTSHATRDQLEEE